MPNYPVLPDIRCTFLKKTVAVKLWVINCFHKDSSSVIRGPIADKFNCSMSAWKINLHLCLSLSDAAEVQRH